jgi:hypothetical protein
MPNAATSVWPAVAGDQPLLVKRAGLSSPSRAPVDTDIKGGA